jgi:hypothetical protein
VTLNRTIEARYAKREGQGPVSIASVAIRAANPFATPEPTPASPTTAANVALSNYYLAVLLLGAAVDVIIIALIFAFNYHAKLLTVINAAVTNNGQVVLSHSEKVTPLGPEPTIAGPDTGNPSAALAFATQLVDALDITWTAEGGTPDSGTGTGFVTSFDKAGTYMVSAKYTTSEGAPRSLDKKVIIEAPATVGAATATAIVLPFVIQNWGRLVIVVFGAGVIAALMSTGILDAAAGIGLLGALLGVGAVTATWGADGDKPAAPAQNQPPPTKQ